MPVHGETTAEHVRACVRHTYHTVYSQSADTTTPEQARVKGQMA